VCVCVGGFDGLHAKSEADGGSSYDAHTSRGYAMTLNADHVFLSDGFRSPCSDL